VEVLKRPGFARRGVRFGLRLKLALLTLVVAPPIAILGQRMGRRIRDISRAE